MKRIHAANTFAATAIAGLFFAHGIPLGVPVLGLVALALQNFVFAPQQRRLGDWSATILHALLVLAAIYLTSLHKPRLDLLVVLLGCAVPFLALTAFVRRTVFQEFLMVLVSFLLAVGGAALSKGWAPLWITTALLLVGCQTLPVLLRPAEAGGGRARIRVRVAATGGWWRFAPHLVRHHLGLLGLGLGAFLYLVVPRHAPAGEGEFGDEALRRRTGAAATAARPGLPSEISLGDITLMRERPGVLLEARFRRNGIASRPRPRDIDLLLLRQTAFGLYDADRHTWLPQSGAPRTLDEGWIRRALTRDEVRIRPIEYGDAAMFVPANARRIDARGISVQSRDGRYLASAQPESYRVETERAPILPASIASAGRSHAHASWLRVPPAIRQYLQDTIGPPSRRTVPAVLAHLRRYFSSFRYDPAVTTGSAPLRKFLRTRRGHCELFATVTCLYLRAWGIPSRLVSGVRCRPDPNRPGVYLAGYEDAHAWVEIAVRDGFAPIDMTPPDPSTNPDAAGGGGDEEQAAAAAAGAAGSEGADVDWTEPFSYGRAERDVVMEWLRDVTFSPTMYLALGAALLTLAVGAALRAWRNRPPDPNRIRPPVGVSRRTLAFYARWLQRCAREGHRRAPHQTPREFWASLPKDLREEGREVTLAFEQRRYGVRPSPPARLQ